MTQLSINDFFGKNFDKRGTNTRNRSHSPINTFDENFLIPDSEDVRSKDSQDKTLSMKSFSIKRHQFKQVEYAYSDREIQKNHDNSTKLMDKSFNNTLDMFFNQETNTGKASITNFKGSNSMHNLAPINSFDFLLMNHNLDSVIKDSTHEISQCLDSNVKSFINRLDDVGMMNCDDKEFVDNEIIDNSNLTKGVLDNKDPVTIKEVADPHNIASGHRSANNVRQNPFAYRDKYNGLNSFNTPAYINRNYSHSLDDYFGMMLETSRLNDDDEALGKRKDSNEAFVKWPCKKLNAFNKQKTLEQFFTKTAKIRDRKWDKLPVYLMQRIMGFQTLKDNTSLSQTCFKWYKCYKTIWYTNTYFNTMNCSSYSEAELRKIFQKSKLPIHKTIAGFFEGKKLGNVLSRSHIEAKQANNNNEGNLLSTQKVRPTKPAVSPIQFDANVIRICEQSYKSLIYLSLNSCGFIGEPSFKEIKKQQYLQLLEITNNPKLSDENVEEILENCTNLANLNLAKCANLSQKSLTTIANKGRNQVRLGLSFNNNMFVDFANYKDLKNLIFLTKLTLNSTNINNDQFALVIKYLPIQDTLSVLGCSSLTFEAIRVMYEYKNIQRSVNMTRIEIKGFNQKHFEHMKKSKENLQIMVDEYHQQMSNDEPSEET